MAITEKPRYWFPAKRYGWGWGPPTAWQGRAVLLAYLVLVLGGIPVIQDRQGSVAYIVFVAVLTIALIAICWFTGEPPRWRWGRRDA